MARFSIFLLLLLSAAHTYAQENFTAPWKSVKLYLNFDVTNSSGGFAKSFAGGTPVGLLTPAFSWSKNARFVHEVGLAALHLGNDTRKMVPQQLDSNIFDIEYVGGWATTDYQLGVRYELAWKWLDWGRSTLYFGGGLTPFIAKATYKSDNPGEYDALEKTAGVHLQGVFRLLFRLSNHWFADINAPAGILLSHSDQTVTQNGVSNNFNILDMGTFMSLRAGLGYRF